MKKYNIIIDTDIGGDIDDTWAIIALVISGKVDVKLISVSNGCVDYKVKVLAKTLSLIGRDDIPIAKGVSFGLDERPLSEFAEDFNENNYKGRIYPNYREAYEDILADNDKFTLLCISPYTSLAQITDVLIRKENLKIISMAGSIERGYFGKNVPDAECNIVSDINAAKTIFSKGLIDVLLPLDVCHDLVIDGENYQRILGCGNKYTETLMKCYRIWQKNYEGGALKKDISKSSSILYDLIVVFYLLFSQNFNLVPMRIAIDDNGYTINGKEEREIMYAKSMIDADEMIKSITDVYVSEDIERKELSEYDYSLFYVQQSLKNDIIIYECGREKCHPFHKFGPTKRDIYLLHFVEQGKGYFIENGVKKNLQANQMFLVKPRAYVEYGAVSDDPWEYCWVGFNGSDAKRIMAKCGLGDKVSIISPKNYQAVKEEIIEILKCRGKSERAEYAMYGHFHILISLMLPNVLFDEEHTDNPVRAAIQYMNKNYMREITIDKIAAEIGFGRTHFYKMFYKEMGLSPKSYLTEIRLKKAMSLMSESSYVLAQIAQIVGYYDYNSFVRNFKSKYGISPSEYRKKPFDNDK